jgi:hypothetical protein
MKIAINKCYGGFSVNDKVAKMLREKGIQVTLVGEYYPDGSGPLDDFFKNHHSFFNEDFGIDNKNDYKWRSDERLIETIEEVGCQNAGGRFASIAIIDIPDDVDWEISNYDGYETFDESTSMLVN